MPYRRVGVSVYKKAKGSWKLVKKHTSIKKAVAHLAALNINVMKKEK